MSSKSGSRRLAIVGISGRMGKEIFSLAAEMGFEVAFGVTRSAAERQAEFGATQLVSSIEMLSRADIDVVIDFSLPEHTPAVVAWCESNRCPLVSGVTGLSAEQKAHFARAGASVPMLWAPNMSLGVAVLARLLSKLSALEGFEFQVEELHHKRKKDAPSGTALFLQDCLENAVGPVPEPVSIRGGGIFGIHRIWAMGEEETLTLEHNAMNRRVFARGGLKAAAWLIGRQPGLYQMDDVL